jgi:IclR family acetate operon transcriptional repressor
MPSRLGMGLSVHCSAIGKAVLGAAIRDHTGAVVGGISASTLAMEHTMAQLAALGPRVRGAAEAVSTALGYVRR